jgi:NitT/TauT family transport system ATP-binding protein
MGQGSVATIPQGLDAAIILREVSKTFGDGNSVTEALSSINLSIMPGEFFSVVGPSGCGKTTMLRLVAGLVEPSVGEVLVRGRPAQTARLNREYGMVFQQPVLLDWRTAIGNVMLPLEIIGSRLSERRNQAFQALELVGLSGFEHRYPWQLSGGMQQRVAIARALVLRPSLLLMDEPFGALDALTREALQAELTNLWNDLDATVMFITHSIPEAVFLSDRVAVMSSRPGRIQDIIEIPLARPRTNETRTIYEFFDLVQKVRACLETGL